VEPSRADRVRATHSWTTRRVQEELARIRKQVVYTVVEMEGRRHRRFTWRGADRRRAAGHRHRLDEEGGRQEAALQALDWIAEQ